MIRISILATILGLTLTACGGGGAGGATPEAAFENYKSALINKDFAAVYDSMSPSRRKQMDDEWKKQMESPQAKEILGMMSEMLGVPADEIKDMSSREFYIKMMSKATDQTSVAEASKAMQDSKILSKKIDGDHAKFKVKFGERERTMKLVKEDGVWYIDETLR